jgi:predicted DNA-binding transcriptional regulator YafY
MDEHREGLEEEGAGGRYEAVARVLCLLRLLGGGNALSREEIFAHHLLRDYYGAFTGEDEEARRKALQRAQRMLRRDLRFLRERGYSIHRARAAGRAYDCYSLDLASGPGLIFRFDQAEVEILLFLSSLCADPFKFNRREVDGETGHPFAEQVQALVARLSAALPDEQRAYFNRWLQRPRVFFNVDTFEDYGAHQQTITWLSEAIAGRRQIQFDYCPLRQEQEVKRYRKIDPYELFFEQGHLYLMAYNPAKARVVEFRVSRILGESLAYDGNSLIDAVHRTPAISFEFLLSSDLAKHGLTQKWLSQEVLGEEETHDEQGRALRWTRVRASAVSELRIIQGLLKYGHRAILLDPPHLVARMRETVEAMAAAYARAPAPG